MILTPEIRHAFTPTGKLRASINLGNPILANQSAGANMPHGVSIDLANNFAKCLGADIELVVFDAAGNVKLQKLGKLSADEVKSWV